MTPFINHMRKFIGDRRRHKRRRVDLLLTITVVTGSAVMNATTTTARNLAPMAGLTHDLSDSHLAIEVPSIRLGGRFLTAPDSRLLITLELPKEQIEFQGTAIRYEKLGEDRGGKGYLIGVVIERIRDEAREHYQEYLRSLK